MIDRILNSIKNVMNRLNIHRGNIVFIISILIILYTVFVLFTTAWFLLHSENAIPNNLFSESIKNACYREQAAMLLVGEKSRINFSEHHTIVNHCRIGQSHVELLKVEK